VTGADPDSAKREVNTVLVAASPGRPTVYLHVGASKTGTTYLQEVLWRNRDRLRQHGTLYPGLSPDAHFRAASDLCDADYQDHPDPLTAGAWQRLIGQAEAWGGSVVLSHELFGLADAAVAQRALRDLSWAEVHLVCTVRDLARQIPATWQEDVKNRQVLTYAEFTAQLRRPFDSAHHLARLFWRFQDTPRMLATWTAAGLPATRVHVVTVPPRGAAPDELWQRFAAVLGIASAGCDTALDRGANASMGLAETGLLRLLNGHFDTGCDGRLDWPTYDVLVKDHLALTVLGGTGTPLRLPASDHGWVATHSRRVVDELRAAGYPVTGALSDLLPPAPPPGEPGSGPAAGTRHPDSATETELLDAAVRALAGLLTWAQDNRRPEEPGWRRTAIALSRRNPGLRRLHHHYLATKARLSDQRRGRG
jgi:hypothetical protein